MHLDPQRIDSVFLAAAEKATAAERAAYLDVACASDPALREELLRRVKEDQDARSSGLVAQHEPYRVGRSLSCPEQSGKQIVRRLRETNAFFALRVRPPGVTQRLGGASHFARCQFISLFRAASGASGLGAVAFVTATPLAPNCPPG
jgi:hypothetical protein